MGRLAIYRIYIYIKYAVTSVNPLLTSAGKVHRLMIERVLRFVLENPSAADSRVTGQDIGVGTTLGSWDRLC